MNVVRNRDTIGNQIVLQTRIQCYNCKGFGHTTKECMSTKRVKDSSYHKDKMLLCKQEEAGVQIQEVIPATDEGIGPVFDKEPLEQCDSDTDPDSSDMSNNRGEADQDEQKFQEEQKCQECKNLEFGLTKSKTQQTNKQFANLEQHCINLEFALQHEKEKNVCENSCVKQYLTSGDKEKALKERNDSLIAELNCKTLESHELRGQLQDKIIAYGELHERVNQSKEKSVETKFEKPLVVRQPNTFKFQKPSVLGRPTPFVNSIAFSTSMP
ncbi:retrovirus-related pol polyprotein from transposon TNT 1-94 [Tanacetum coccineum]